MCQLYKKKYFMIDLDLLRSSLMKNEKQKSCHNPLIGLWVMKTLFIGNLKYILRISYIWFNHFLHIYVCCRACRDCERSENLGVLYEVNLTSQCSHLEVLLKSKFGSERGEGGFQMMQILGLLGGAMYFDAAVVFVTDLPLLFRLDMAILWYAST